ncbi:MAG: hypothetical protein QOJ70_3197 [Acidobacteriota bacterium]|jgi:hypothetical protein|nr:hypothetical protein [Acidobacteriota bacterium]
MKKISAKFPTLVALLVAVACATALTPTANAQASSTTENVTVPIDFIATSCSGETVTISGESHVVVHSTTTDNHTTFETHIQFHLDGTSASGTRYIANETVNSIENTSTGGAQVLNSTGQLHLISQGSADNLVVSTTIHVTVNANGQITSTTFEFTTNCNG